jgi:hypothetical protein
MNDLVVTKKKFMNDLVVTKNLFVFSLGGDKSFAK